MHLLHIVFLLYLQSTCMHIDPALLDPAPCASQAGISSAAMFGKRGMRAQSAGRPNSARDLSVEQYAALFEKYYGQGSLMDQFLSKSAAESDAALVATLDKEIKTRVRSCASRPLQLLSRQQHTTRPCATTRAMTMPVSTSSHRTPCPPSLILPNMCRRAVRRGQSTSLPASQASMGSRLLVSQAPPLQHHPCLV